MTPNYMKYQSFCYNVPQVILGLFRLGMCAAVSLHHHGGAGWGGGLTWLSVMMQKDVRTNLVLFRLPSSGRVLAVVLFFESQVLTPSTRSSTSESVSVSSPL